MISLRTHLTWKRGSAQDRSPSTSKRLARGCGDPARQGSDCLPSLCLGYPPPSCEGVAELFLMTPISLLVNISRETDPIWRVYAWGWGEERKRWREYGEMCLPSQHSEGWDREAKMLKSAMIYLAAGRCTECMCRGGWVMECVRTHSLQAWTA